MSCVLALKLWSKTLSWVESRRIFMPLGLCVSFVIFIIFALIFRFHDIFHFYDCLVGT